MKKTVFALAVVPLLAACLPPQGVTQEDLAAFDAAVASVGCKLETDAQYLPVELQTGIPREKLLEIAQYKINIEEAATLESGGLRLMTGTCAPATAAAEA